MANKKRVCLIGLGTITQRYISGLTSSDALELVAVSDINESAVARKCYENYPFYRDYKLMISDQKPDYVIISTPPEGHFDIAQYCLNNDIGIIIEKPVTLNSNDFKNLIDLAQKNNLLFKTLFHWHGGIETRYFTENYKHDEIREIKINICDPYCDNNEFIIPEKRQLMGAWIDSGVNALSMIRLWLPFNKLEIISTECKRCDQTDLPIYARIILLIDGVKTEIAIDWRKGINHKESYITVGDRCIYINHSEQYVSDGIVTELARISRLDEHYNYLFTNFSEASNAIESASIHEFLFRINEVL